MLPPASDDRPTVRMMPTTVFSPVPVPVPVPVMRQWSSSRETFPAPMEAWAGNHRAAEEAFATFEQGRRMLIAGGAMGALALAAAIVAVVRAVVY